MKGTSLDLNTENIPLEWALALVTVENKFLSASKMSSKRQSNGWTKSKIYMEQELWSTWN